MKNYFDFHLTGRQLIPWFVLYLVVALSQSVFPSLGGELSTGYFDSLVALLFLILYILVQYSVMFFITKLYIEHVSYKGTLLVFNGSFQGFFGRFLLGFLLTIITLGIYLPWFMRDITRYFVDNTSYNSEPFRFNGSGGNLFLIFFLGVVVPLIIFVIVLSSSGLMGGRLPSKSDSLYPIVIIYALMIPVSYFVYKWMVDVNFKDLRISWHTDFASAIGKITLEILLTVITVGIYLPMAIVRLHRYFAHRTLAVGGERTLRFGYDADEKNDFLFIWKQLLLSIVTLGIYYAWGSCKVTQRILSKTYLEETPGISDN